MKKPIYIGAESFEKMIDGNYARKGLEQIGEKAYVYNLKREGYGRIYKYGIAFHKKSCEVAMGNVSIEL